MKPRFFICRHCGNIVTFLHESGAPVSCCGEPMQELIAGQNDGAAEKHVPVIEKNGTKVTVNIGAVNHPMTAEHYIEWIALTDGKGLHIQSLAPGDAPQAVFSVETTEDITAYAFCNLHQLWKA